MKEIIKNEKIETVEAEIVDENFESNNYTPNFEFEEKEYSLYGKIKKSFLNFLFFIASIFIIIGTILTLTIIGMFIGIPLIIIGILILFLAIKLFFKSKFIIKF